MMQGNFYKTSSSPDGAIISSIPWDSGIINGKGRYYDKKTGKSIISINLIQPDIFKNTWEFHFFWQSVYGIVSQPAIFYPVPICQNVLF